MESAFKKWKWSLIYLIFVAVCVIASLVNNKRNEDDAIARASLRTIINTDDVKTIAKAYSSGQLKSKDVVVAILDKYGSDEKYKPALIKIKYQFEENYVNPVKVVFSIVIVWIIPVMFFLFIRKLLWTSDAVINVAPQVIEDELCEKILASSITCAEKLKPELLEKYGDGSTDYDAKLRIVIFEYIYFFTHVVMRTSYSLLGNEKRGKLQDAIIPLVTGKVTKTLFGSLVAEKKLKLEEEFCRNYNNSELEYSKCKTLFLKPDEDSYFDKKESSGTRKALINELADNISNVITGSEIDMHIHILVIDGVLEILRENNFEKILAALK